MTRRRKRRRRTIYHESFFERLALDPETKKDVWAIFLFVLAVISILAIFDVAGPLGRFVVVAFQWLMGGGFVTIPFVFVGFGYLIMSRNRIAVGAVNYIGLFLLVFTYSGLLHLRVGADDVLSTKFDGIGGGIVGFLVRYPLEQIAGFWVTLVLLIGFLIIAFLLLFNTSLSDIAERCSVISGVFSRLRLFRFRRSFGAREEEKDSGEEDEDYLPSDVDPSDDEKDAGDDSESFSADFENKSIASVDGVSLGDGGESAEAIDLSNGIDKSFTRRRKHPKIDLPLDLLYGESGVPTSGDIDYNKQVIQKTLANFGIDVEMGDVAIGPTVTQFTLRPAEGVKLSRITSLANDLSLALAAHPIRIEAPIPGKSLVGVEVPNQKVALVPLKDILSSKEFKKRTSPLMVSLGKDVAGKPCLVDLSSLPHLLIAGATGSGKSVMVNSLIISLLFQNQPGDLKFILVDPKRVELTGYDGIPHLLTPVITDVDKTISALRWLIGEMDRRFDLLSKSRNRNIQSYNLSPIGDPLPYIVVVIDELADLMAVASAEMEAVIVRLAQMARAVGIHLVLATQRPSVDVITGLIKANITARIAFSVASLVDSRTILDMSGAEKLLGRGDMLFMSATISKPKRLQGAFISDREIEGIVDYLKSKDDPDYEEGIVKFTAGDSGGRMGDMHDDMFEDARELVVNSGKASASFLQRRLRVGYARAARLMDLLEDSGVVGPPDGAKPREVLMAPDDLLDLEEENSAASSHNQTDYKENDEEEDREGIDEREEDEDEDLLDEDEEIR